MNKEQLKFIHEQYKKQNKYFNLDFKFKYDNKVIVITDERVPRESNRGQTALIKGVVGFIDKLINVNFEGVIIFKPSVGKNNPVTVKDNHGVINYTYKDMGNIDNGLNRYQLKMTNQDANFVISKETSTSLEATNKDSKTILEKKDVTYDILDDRINAICIKRKKHENDKSGPRINSLIKTLYNHCLKLKQPVEIIIESDNNVILSIGNKGKRCITMGILIKSLKLAAMVR